MPIETSIISRNKERILNSFIDALSLNSATQTIIDWARDNKSKYVCICNVHSVVTAMNEPEFQSIINQADMATPDGYPIAWMLRRKGHLNQQRIDGPGLMLNLFEQCADSDIRIFLYGSTQSTLKELILRLNNMYPDAEIVGSISPPFHALTPDEENNITQIINKSRAQIVFVGLGCPKQEIWMARNRDHINAVMIGVGAAFDYHAGTLKRAPEWMQRNGFEWLYRLVKEPRRLWKRYLQTNTKFVYHAIKTLISH